MKKLLLFVFISLFYFQSKAQDPQLFGNDWYLHNLIIDGEDNIPPINEEVPFIIAIYYPPGSGEEFNSGVCNALSGEEILYDDPNSTLEFITGLIQTLIVCEDGNNQYYESLYFNFYYDDITEPFFYNITNYNGNKTLILISASGDEAIFGEELLSNQDFYASSFSIYPNPTNGVLSIENTSITKITSIKLYDVLGRFVMEEKGDVNQLDVSSLNNGLFILEIETNEGVITKKIIKE